MDPSQEERTSNEIPQDLSSLSNQRSLLILGKMVRHSCAQFFQEKDIARDSRERKNHQRSWFSRARRGDHIHLAQLKGKISMFKRWEVGNSKTHTKGESNLIRLLEHILCRFDLLGSFLHE